MENIKDFMIQCAEEKPEVEKKKKREAEFETVVVSGPDFVLRKKTAKTSTIMAIMPSTRNYYIKNEKTGSIQPLTDATLRNFMSGVGESKRVDVVDKEGNRPFWTDCLYSQMSARTALLQILDDETLLKYMCSNMIKFDLQNVNTNYSFSKIPMSEIQFVFNEAAKYEDREALKIALESFMHGGTYYNITDKNINLFNGMFYTSKNKEGIKYSFQMLEEMYHKDGIRMFIEAFYRTPVISFPVSHTLDRIFYRSDYINIRGVNLVRYANNANETNEMTNFDRDSFINYAFYEACEQGYESNIDNFYSSWADTLNMEIMFYGKIVDKYPANLASYENRLAQKCRNLARQVDEEMFAKAVEEMKQYEYVGKNFRIICPKTKQDMIDEGQSMSNCVASYTGMVANGNCYIFFLRRNEHPDESFVTVEVRKDKSLGQVKARFNRQPSQEAFKFVQNWHEKMFGEDNRIAV